MLDARADGNRHQTPRARALAVSLFLHLAVGWWLLRPGAPMPAIQPAPRAVSDLTPILPPEPVAEPDVAVVKPTDADDGGGGGGGSEPVSPTRPVISRPPSGRTPSALPHAQTLATPTPLPVPVPVATAPPAPTSLQNGGIAGTGAGVGTADGSGTGSGEGSGSGSGEGSGAGSGTGDGRGAGGTRLVRAEWIRQPSAQVMEEAYPWLAVNDRIRGLVRLSCRVSRDRVPVDCRTLQESPRNYGFARGAKWAVTSGLVRPPVLQTPEANVRVHILVVFEPPPLPTSE